MKRLNTGRGYILAERVVDGIPINPKLPPNFDTTPNDERPDSHRKFWYVPFIASQSLDEMDAYYAGFTDQWAEEARAYWKETGRPLWMEAWPTGTRYDVRCLDGGAWDRSTFLGAFATLSAALASIGRRES